MELCRPAGAPHLPAPTWAVGWLISNQTPGPSQAKLWLCSITSSADLLSKDLLHGAARRRAERRVSHTPTPHAAPRAPGSASLTPRSSCSVPAARKMLCPCCWGPDSHHLPPSASPARNKAPLTGSLPLVPLGKWLHRGRAAPPQPRIAFVPRPLGQLEVCASQQPSQNGWVTAKISQVAGG